MKVYNQLGPCKNILNFCCNTFFRPKKIKMFPAYSNGKEGSKILGYPKNNKPIPHKDKGTRQNNLISGFLNKTSMYPINPVIIKNQFL